MNERTFGNLSPAKIPGKIENGYPRISVGISSNDDLNGNTVGLVKMIEDFEFLVARLS